MEENPRKHYNYQVIYFKISRWEERRRERKLVGENDNAAMKRRIIDSLLNCETVDITGHSP